MRYEYAENKPYDFWTGFSTCKKNLILLRFGNSKIKSYLMSQMT